MPINRYLAKFANPQIVLRRRLLGPIGDIPPAEFEQMCDQQQQSRLVEAGLN